MTSISTQDDCYLITADGWKAETTRINQALTSRVKELAERYETPLPQLTRRVADLEAVTWKGWGLGHERHKNGRKIFRPYTRENPYKGKLSTV